MFEGVAASSDEELSNSIAVVGMSCRLPGANTPEDFWALLCEGRHGIRKFPAERYYPGPQDPREEGGYLICPIDEFDAKFFAISPKEAVLMDPQQRLLLEVVWQCLENAGINPQTLRGSDTSFYVGMWQQDYERLIQPTRDDLVFDDTDLMHLFMGNKHSATASRIAFCYDFHGPCLGTESGCSSAFTGLHLACESLLHRETSLALVSGVNLVLKPVNPFTGKPYEGKPLILAADRKCKTFDEDADGFVRSEAITVVALKRMSDARRDADNILAVIRATALNNDGGGKSFGTPRTLGQQLVYREALRKANVRPADVSYVETHGTGTVVGDPIEMNAVGQVYSEGRTEPLLIGAVKPNIGHTEGASGMPSLIKAILCLQHEAIPPQLNFNKLNPRINLDAIPARIPLTLTPWTNKRKIAGVSTLSMTSTNVHVILEQAPKVPPLVLEREPHLEMITLSTKSETALSALRHQYIDFLKLNRDALLKDIAYTTNLGRAHLTHRIAVVAKDTPQLLARLEAQDFVQGVVPSTKLKIGFLFTGQGSQYFGMSKGLSEAFPAFKRAFERCAALFESCLNQSLHRVLFEDESLLSQGLFSQPAIFCFEVCLLQLWCFFGIKPHCVLGHSLGEFAAAVGAGFLTPEDALTMVVQRSRLIQGLPSGYMLALSTNKEQALKLVNAFLNTNPGKEAWVDMAAVNSTTEVVLSVGEGALERLTEFLTSHGVKHSRLAVSHAFHSRDMEPIMPAFASSVETVAVGTPICAFISGTLAKPMKSAEMGAEYWLRHLRDTVRFSQAVQLMWAECKVLVEVGPRPILLSLAMTNVGDSSAGVFCASQRRNEDPALTFVAAMQKLYVAGLDFDWRAVHGVRQKRLQLPTYPFDHEKFWVEERESKDSSPHPLIGKTFPSPLPQTIFSQTLELSRLTFLDDYKLAGQVVLPVGAILETFLATGRELLQPGARNPFPLTIHNLTVNTPLPLSKPAKCQTLVSPQTETTEGGFRLSLSREHLDQWKQHAGAELAKCSEAVYEATLELETFKSGSEQMQSLDSFYENMTDLGLNLGPRFQSIKAAWVGPKELLAEIHLSEDMTNWVCHPILLEAMIQTALLGQRSEALEENNNKRGLPWPVRMRKFAWLHRAPSSIVFALRTTGSATVRLFNSRGEPLAVMHDLEFEYSNKSAVAIALKERIVELPALRCERWCPAPHEVYFPTDESLTPAKESPEWLLVKDSSDLCQAIELQLQRENRRNVTLLGLESAATAKAVLDQVKEKLEGILCFFTDCAGDCAEEAQSRILNTLLQLLQSYENNWKLRPKIMVVTRGLYCVGDDELCSPHAATAWGLTKVFRRENPSTPMALIDLDSTPTDFEAAQVSNQLWNRQNELFFAFRQEQKYVLRLVNMESPAAPIRLPNSSSYKVLSPTSGLVADIDVVPCYGLRVGEEDVMVEVRAAALNFEHLFHVLKSTEDKEKDMTVGLDIAGVVVGAGSKVSRFRVGDEVYGLARSGALASHTLASEKRLMRMSTVMTFSEAATLPSAYLTATLALVQVAQTTAADYVLVHAAAGGVGLAAVNILQKIGAKIFATAGTKKKRAYLRTLGLKYVYNSADTSYGEAILRDTNGKGVSVVLNTLTGPRLVEVTLMACRPSARFVEVTKQNVWEPEQVQALRPDINYTILHMSKNSLLRDVHGEHQVDTEALLQRIESSVHEGALRSLPYTAHVLSNVQTAFRVFQKAQHIGKVVLQMPTATLSTAGQIQLKEELFNAKSSYLITGGLDGIGLKMAEWLLSQGARTIILLGRTLASKTTEALMANWKREGSNIVLVQADVGDLDNCHRVLEQIKTEGLPPLRGVFHATEVQHDAWLSQQTTASLELIYRSTVYGAWNLHRLSLDYDLEFFVLCANMASRTGKQGQSGLEASNHFLDVLAQFRLSLGLPATAVNWGSWADVDVVAEAERSKRTDDFIRKRILTADQGVAALEAIMKSGVAQAVVCDLPDVGLVKGGVNYQGNYFDELLLKQSDVKKYSKKCANPVEDIQKAGSTEERLSKLHHYVELVLKQTLSLPTTAVLNPDQSFTQFGVDSVMYMEMRNRFKSLLKPSSLTLSVNALRDNDTIRALSAYLALLV